MAADLRRFLDGLNRHPGASHAAIIETEKQVGLKLPAEYVELLKLTNGGEGFVGKNAYVMLWSVEELASRNQSYEVQKCAPGLLIFGSDGGDEAYGFDTRTSRCPIVQIPFVGMTWNAAQPIGELVSSFLERLYETE